MNEVMIRKVNDSGAWDRPLARHLAVIVLLKLLFLFLLWFLFFRSPDGAGEPGLDIHNHIAGVSGTAVFTQIEASP